jgi:uncharacterized protein
VIDPLVVAFGLGVGILIGLTGIGGGSLMTPLLVLVVGVQPVVAIGTDLAYGAITKTVGGWRRLRSGAVDRGVSKWLALGSVPGSITGVLAVDALHNRYGYGYGFDSTLLVLVAVALLFVALSVLAPLSSACRASSTACRCGVTSRRWRWRSARRSASCSA